MQRIRAGFQTKVLIPVIIVMVSLVAATLIIVNERIITSVERDMSQKLLTADAVFRNFQKIRVKSLVLRYKNISNEPRFRAVVQLPDPNTVRFTLGELVEQAELGADLVAFAGAADEPVISVAQDPRVDREALLTHFADGIEEARTGQPVGDLVVLGDRLYDMVGVPVMVGERVIGAFIVGSEMGEEAVAREMSQLTDCEIAFLANGRTLLTTVKTPGANESIAAIYAARARAEVSKTLLGTDHYLALANRLPTRNAGTDIGYVLLSSYEDVLMGLRETKRTLLTVGLLGTLLGATFIWYIIRSVTRPLRSLRDSAEAVGKGDYSQRVVVSSRDEVGDLSQVFNQMTTNVQASRNELERTLETLKVTQEQLIQREKLSAIGEFVAGVTHELNNPLTSVVGYSELLQLSPLDETQARDVNAIVTGAKRCQKIVQNLLSFARQHKAEKKPANINDVMQSVLEFMQYDLRTSNIAVETRFGENLPRVLIDAHQVQQVFVNIIQNGRQAIESFRPDGRMTITTEAVEGVVRVTLQDNGPGISAENVSRIFDPFFTTKPVGKGTGLGLSLSYGIIKEHGGSIDVKSTVGQGAAFIIELPICIASQASGQTQSGIARRVQNPNEGAGRRILVIDDESGIVEFVRDALVKSGYTVEVETSGEAAVKRLTNEAFDLVVCDMKMPGLNGQQTFEKINAGNTTVAQRFVFMTGDVMNQRHQEFFQKYKLTCLPKPFTIEEIRQAVARAIAT